MTNIKENTKKEIIQACCEGKITESDAAMRLKLSIRQVQRLKAKYKKGISFLHGNCGRLPSTTLPPLQQQKILKEFLKPAYKNVNFSHFTELISSLPFAASYTAISNLLKKEGYKSPKARRKTGKKTHKTRERRAKFGELIQGDGTPFDWFGIGEMQTLHVFIDDATGKLVGLHMSKSECMDGYLESTRYMLETHGTPESFYFDGLSIFFYNKKEKENLTIEEELAGVTIKKTQFGKICDELGVELIHARSPQAKGRVERVNGTLQSRLPVEFALRRINNIDDANKFLKEKYIDIFNAKFGVNNEAKSSFLPLPNTVNLDELLTWKISRKTDNGGCFSLKKHFI